MTTRGKGRQRGGGDTSNSDYKRAEEQRGKPGHVGQSHMDSARGRHNTSNMPEAEQHASKRKDRGR